MKKVFSDNARVIDSNGVIHETEGKVIIDEPDGKVLFQKEEHFVKFFYRVLPRLLDELSNQEVKVFLALMPYVSYEDCVLRRTGRGNSEILTMKSISEVTGIDYSRIRKILPVLERKGVIGHHVTGSILEGHDGEKTKVYTVNPFIYFKGNCVNKMVYEFYQKSGWKCEW